MLYIRKGKQTFVVKPRALPDTGVVNFRDLGGYVNLDGQQVRYDCFYRSAPLCDLQKEHVEYLQQLHIQHILDLRSDMERKGKEDIHLPEAKYHPISAITFDQGMDVIGFIGLIALFNSLQSFPKILLLYPHYSLHIRLRSCYLQHRFLHSPSYDTDCLRHNHLRWFLHQHQAATIAKLPQNQCDLFLHCNETIPVPLPLTPLVQEDDTQDYQKEASYNLHHHIL